MSSWRCSSRKRFGTCSVCGFQSATERLETPSEMLKARREVSRIKTIQREREIAAAKKQPAGQGA